MRTKEQLWDVILNALRDLQAHDLTEVEQAAFARCLPVVGDVVIEQEGMQS